MWTTIAVGRSIASGLRRVCGGTEGMSSHVRCGGGLTPCAGGRCRGRRLHVLSWDAAIEPAADPLCDAHLTAGKGSCSGYQIPQAAIARDFRLEQNQHMLCAVRGPRRDGPPVSFAECLRTAHMPCFQSLFPSIPDGEPPSGTYPASDTSAGP